MQTITIDNYEAYLLDFSEGNLSDDLQVELELFLIQHPELEIDLSVSVHGAGLRHEYSAQFWCVP